MRRIDELFSMAQKDISDEEFQRVQRQEWYDYSERVLYDIGENTRAFLSSPTLIPNVIGSGLTDVRSVTIPAEYKALKFIKVIRGVENNQNGVECNELSHQAIDNELRGEYMTPINWTRLTGNTFHAMKLPSEEMQLWFGYPFKEGEAVRIHIIGGANVVPVHWRHIQDILVPDYMVDVIRFGLLTKALERLQFQATNNEYSGRYGKAEQMYARSMMKLKAYLVNLKDERSTNQTQSFVWLPE